MVFIHASDQRLVALEDLAPLQLESGREHVVVLGELLGDDLEFLHLLVRGQFLLDPRQFFLGPLQDFWMATELGPGEGGILRGGEFPTHDLLVEDQEGDQVGLAVAEDRGLQEPRALLQRLLDHRGDDVLAVGGDEHLLDAALDVKIAVLVDVALVAGVEPAILVDRLAGGLLAVVAPHQGAAPHQNLVVVAQLDLDAAERQAHRADLVAAARVDADGGRDLGQAVALQDLDPDGLEELDHFRVDGRAAADDAAQAAAELLTDLLVEEQLADPVGGEVEEGGGVFFGFFLVQLGALLQHFEKYVVEPFGALLEVVHHAGADLLEQARHRVDAGGAKDLDVFDQLGKASAVIDLRAEEERTEEPRVAFEGVAERQHREDDVLRRGLDRLVAEDGGVGQPPVGEEHALHLAGGPRGEDDGGEVLALDLGSVRRGQRLGLFHQFVEEVGLLSLRQLAFFERFFKKQHGVGARRKLAEEGGGLVLDPRAQDQHLGAGLVEDLGDLVDGQDGVDGDEDDAELVDGEVDDRPVGVVG